MKTSARTLKRLAGAIWFAVGTMLALRGGLMLVKASRLIDAPSLWGLSASLLAGIGIGAFKGRVVLSRAARRNIKRIEKLASPRTWNVFSGRLAVLIVLMIGLGVLLRSAAAEGYLGGYTVVGGIYIGIGSALVVSSLVYFIPPPPPLDTHPVTPPPKLPRPTGVLVVNLGTPDEPTPPAVRRYLREFLGDPRVIEVNRWLWAFVLNVIILPRRAGASAEAYRKVWGPGGSPLLRYTRQAADALADRLGSSMRVEVGMRYGNPSLGAAIERLLGHGCEPIVVLPLFPQFSNTTTGSVQAEVARLVCRRRDQPAIQFLAPYYDHPAYIAAVAARVREAGAGQEIEHYVFSFHGLPEAYVRRGDPYVDHCTRTAWALAAALGLERASWDLAFQSRFGDEPWLQPYLDERVPELVRSGKRRMQIVVAGFAADCLETLEEIGIQLRADFEAAGGEELIVTPALNDHPQWIEALETLVLGAPGRVRK